MFCVASHPTNNVLVASGGEDDKAYVWDAVTGNIALRAEGHTDSVTVVGFSTDGKYLATGGEVEMAFDEFFFLDIPVADGIHEVRPNIRRVIFFSLLAPSSSLSLNKTIKPSNPYTTQIATTNPREENDLSCDTFRNLNERMTHFRDIRMK